MTYFFTVMSGYRSAKIIEIGQDLTEIQNDKSSLSLFMTTAKCSRFCFYEVARTHTNKPGKPRTSGAMSFGLRDAMLSQLHAF